MAITRPEPHTAAPVYFPTVIEPYDAICEDCGREFKDTTKEFCYCDGFLIDTRRLDTDS